MMVGSRAEVILLNGVGSAGKTALAQELQRILALPFLHVQMDAFLNMLPARYGNHPDAFSYFQFMTDGNPEVKIEEGALGAQVLRGMRASVAAMAEQGLNLIIDDVLMGSSDPGLADYQRRLSGYRFRTVGLFATLEILEQREKDRGDRMLGLARWQFERVHSGMSYDLVLQTDSSTPATLAELVCRQFALEAV